MRRVLAWLGGILIPAAFIGASFWERRRGPGGVIALVGVGLILTALWFFLQRAFLLRKGRSVPGEVVRLEQKEGVFAPVFRCTDAGGSERLITSGSASNPPDHQVGDRVEVLFYPERPEEAVIRSFGSMWGAAIVVTVLGLIFLTVGLLFFLNLIPE